MIKGSLWRRTLPYFSMAVRAVTEIESCTKPVMNQATQCTALFKPIIFITCGKTPRVNHGTTLELFSNSHLLVTPVCFKRKFSLFSHLFQSLLLLCYDVLDHHGYRVDPGYDHTQRHHVLDNKQKTANGKTCYNSSPPQVDTLLVLIPKMQALVQYSTSTSLVLT